MYIFIYMSHIPANVRGLLDESSDDEEYDPYKYSNDPGYKKFLEKYGETDLLDRYETLKSNNSEDTSEDEHYEGDDEYYELPPAPEQRQRSLTPIPREKAIGCIGSVCSSLTKKVTSMKKQINKLKKKLTRKRRKGGRNKNKTHRKRKTKRRRNKTKRRRNKTKR